MARFTVLGVVLVGCGSAPLGTPMGADLQVGRTLSPGCAGSPYATIQSAINAAVANDIVEVCPGTYNERLTIVGKTLTLRSRDGAATTTIDAQGIGKGLSLTSNANVTVDGFTFLNGSTTGTGGNVHCNGSTVTLLDSVLRGGEADKGGGFGVIACSGRAEGNTVDDNHATWSGAGVYIQSDTLTFEGNTLLSNTADTNGGGLYLDGDSAVVDNTFDGNHAEKNGGAVFVNYGLGDILDNTVVRNTSVDDGAGIYVSFGAPLVARNTFEANDTDDEGGGLRVKLGNPTIEDNLFLSNHADYRGGALKVSHDWVVMTGNTYIGNTAWVTGGAVLLYESASDLSGETYEDNTAEFGGGLAVLEGWGGVNIDDATFINNTANEDGGHLYVDLANQTTRVRRTSFTGGLADDGGGVYALESVLVLENTSFSHNEATESGGAIYLDTSSGDILNTVAIWNEAPDGSALTVSNSGNLDVVNTVFRANTGGAAFRVATGGVPRVRYSDFSGNSSDFSGLGNVIGTNGNIAVAPSFVSAASGNFALRAGSPLVNAGDPAISDPNGSRSDIGRFGGPQAY